MADQAENEEKIEAAGQFLIQAPLGEYKEVRDAVSLLLEDDQLLDKASELLPAHLESSCAPLKTEKSPGYILLTEASRLDTGVYGCPRAGLAYVVDYGRKEVTSERELTEEESAQIGLADDLRIALEKETGAYIDEHHDKYGKYAVTKCGNEYHISVHSNRARSDNFTSGVWQVKGMLKPDEEGFSLDLENIVTVHYYEDGNVQMNSSTKDGFKIAKGDVEKMATEIVGTLNKFVVNYHSKISDYYLKMQDSTFKLLRRQLPITKSKIDWDKLQLYNLAKES